MKNLSMIGDIFLNTNLISARVSSSWRTAKKRGDAMKTRDSARSAEGNPLKIQITYRNYFCPATVEDLRRGNKLAHWRRTWRHKSRRTYERPFININKPYVSVGHNDTIVARSIPRGFSWCWWETMSQTNRGPRTPSSPCKKENIISGDDRSALSRVVPRNPRWYYVTSYPRCTTTFTAWSYLKVNEPAAKSPGMSRGRVSVN